MAKISQAAKIGLFVAITAGAGYLVFRTVGTQMGGGKGYVVHAYLKDATGIAKHSRVTIAGIPVGQVQDIRLEDGRARIDVRVNPEVKLHESSRLGVKSASLLGENVVVLTEGVGEPDKKDGDEVQTLPDARSVEDLKETVGRIADLVEQVAKQLAASIGSEQGGRNMKAILQNLADATEAINITVRENRAVIHNALTNVDRISANSAPEIEKILVNVRVITEDVKTMLAAQGGKDGESGELRSTIERVNRASKSLESALAHVDNVAGRIDRGEGTVGRLTKDEALINEVQGVAEGVNDYVDSLRRLQTIVGLRSDYNFLANTIKSYVELRLQPREDKYYLIQLINDPRGKTSFTQTDVDTTNPNDPAHYRTTTTTTTDAFRFTVQFAKRIGPFTGRFGIMESTGGIGLDTDLLSDRFEIKQDLFGFGEEIRPRYRVSIAYEFIKRLWLIGGADYIFLPNRRDYFLGLQLRFTDDDLKTILPFASTGAVGK
ncbi:Mammalian cell entry related domain protein [Labilithrix luteola]|uniref:Mammalian cell entry related domain protein n=1 Tax=Labilithrix luteola TaxID=1391654 RepID=A0A0K1QDQ7_9BACT|nr:MlaD family protein [Labilithrix luteola]AKV03570.1 Mammalian cell entry related domain protein [Labilithrix luteola]